MISFGNFVKVDPGILTEEERVSERVEWSTDEARPRRLRWRTASDTPAVNVEETLKREDADPDARAPILQPPGAGELVRKIVSKHVSARAQRPKIAQLKTIVFFRGAAFAQRHLGAPCRLGGAEHDRHLAGSASLYTCDELICVFVLCNAVRPEWLLSLIC